MYVARWQSLLILMSARVAPRRGVLVSTETICTLSLASRDVMEERRRERGTERGGRREDEAKEDEARGDEGDEATRRQATERDRKKRAWEVGENMGF